MDVRIVCTLMCYCSNEIRNMYLRNWNENNIEYLEVS